MDAKQLLDNYYKWLKDNTILQYDSAKKWAVINTPFTGVFNDMIEIYIKVESNKIFFSDDGVTLSNLELSGVNISKSAQRKKILENILLNHGVNLAGNDLVSQCDINSFPARKHSFLEALIEINDMFMLSKEHVASVFKDDVEEFLNEIDVIYTRDFKFSGHSGLDFNFDFLIATKSTEKVLRAINYLNVTTLTTFLYAWEDIIPTRQKISKKEVEAIAIINDEKKSIKPEYIEALLIKQADSILWSERHSEDNINKLKVA